MDERKLSVLRKAFGTEELSEKDVKYRVVRSCVGIATVACVLYGLCSVPAGEVLELKQMAEEAPRLVILGREDEETVALIAETIQQEDGTVLSLNDYLNTMICGSCSRRCPLLLPRCRRGMTKAETQTEYYNEAVALLESGDASLGVLRYTDLML